MPSANNVYTNCIIRDCTYAVDHLVPSQLQYPQSFSLCIYLLIFTYSPFYPLISAAQPLFLHSSLR